MKSLQILFLILFTAFTSCSKDDSNNNNELPGSWQLVERYIHDGNSGQWVVEEDGYILAFLNNGVISSSEFECEGDFNTAGEELNFNFPCGDGQTSYSYNYYFENGFLYFFGPWCDEGCEWKFQKLSE